MKKLYLANPYGFSTSQREYLLPKIIEKIQSLGIEVLEPFEENNQVDFSKKDWAYDVGQDDVHDVLNCDGIFAVVNGLEPDSGVMVELGIAIGYNKLIDASMLFADKKQIFLFRDDFRNSTDSEMYPLNLMLFTGLPKEGWEKNYFTSISDIVNKNKNLYHWSKE
jgi:nucleoside 2-deoxyribosyltransferase